MCVKRERESVQRERDGKCAQTEERNVFRNRERGSVCSDRERVCGKIGKGSVREERKRGRDRVCAEW